MSRRILLIWGFIWLFLWLAASMYLAPRVEVAAAQEKSAHSHALCLSFLVIIMGFAQPFLGLSEGLKSVFAVILGVGSFLLPIGVLIGLASKAAGSALATIVLIAR